MTVTAVLVSHDGERWLPRVLAGLARQTRRPDATWAVDTGSADASPGLLRDAVGADRLLVEAPTTPYAAAVRAALDADAATTGADGDDWIWLLHDDSAPAPDALEALLAAAERHPDASLLTPKLREWPSLRRLLEIGVTVSGTAKRETGLERGEYDQGQHDRVREVLAGNTAGLLVRRRVLDEIGLDPALGVFAADLDLGWRAAHAGLRTLAVPAAVVFHAEAAHRGQRTGPWTARPRRAERTGQIRTVLANCSPAALPFVYLRLVLGTLLRALGFLLVRAPGDAWDEAAAALGVGLRPWRVLASRRRRRRTRTVSAREVRPLLPSPWLPYRRGWDSLGDLVSELWHLAREGLARRSQERSWAWGLVAGVALLAAAALAGRDLLAGALTGGVVAGGALLPAPADVGTWWSAIGQQPVAAWLLPAAAVATLLLGSPGLLVHLVLVLAVPLATFAALRFFRQLLGPGVAWWAALAYGLTLGVSGAVGSGQLGTLVAGIVLPLLGRSALGMLPFAAPEQRRRAVWRVAAWLALTTAFAPSAWLLAVLVTLVALGIGLRHGAVRAVLPVLVPVVMTPLLLLPWVGTRLETPGLLLLEAGLPTPYAGLDALEVLTGRVGDGAPAWWGLGIAVAALVVLLRADTRVYVAWCWAFGGLALVLAGVLTRVAVTVPGTGETLVPTPTYPLLVAQAALICAAALGGDGARRQITGASFGWRQPVAAVIVLGAVASPLAAAVWWVSGQATEDLRIDPRDPVPAYMTQISQAQDGYDVLVLHPVDESGVGWTVRRGAGVRLGLESAALATPYDTGTARAVVDLLTDGGPDAVGALVAQGVGYVYAAPPAPRRVVATLDATSGLAPASAPQRRAAAWQLEGAGTGERPHERVPELPWLLLGQGLAVVAVVVLAAPGRRSASTETAR